MLIIVITVCIGSGCHVKGSRDIIKILRDYIEKREEEIDLKLAACFCQGRCTEGVVVKFNDEIVTDITKKSIIPITKEKIESVKPGGFASGIN